MGGNKSKPNVETHSTDTQTGNEKKTQLVTKNKELNKNNQQVLVTDREIDNIVQTMELPAEQKSTILAQDIHQAILQFYNNSPLVREIQQQRQKLTETYLTPVIQSYNRVPGHITSFKFTYLNCYDYNDRLVALGLLSTIIGVLSYRKAMVHQLPLRTLSAIKDSAVGYFIGGLLIAPQIYNPLMNE